MNKKIYSLVWNQSLHQVVVTSELATVRSGGGGAGGESSSGFRGPRRALLGLAAALALCLAPWSAAFAGQTNCSGAAAAGNKALACGNGASAH